MSVTVIRSCAVSTERGAAGAELDPGCPSHAKQSLVRELSVGSEGAPGVREQLVLVVNF